MSVYQNLRLKRRLSIYLIFLIGFILITLGTIIFQTQQREFSNLAKKQLQVSLDDITTRLEKLQESKEQRVYGAVRFSKFLLSNSGDFKINDSVMHDFVAVSELGAQEVSVSLQEWTFSNKSLQINTDFVLLIKSVFNTEAAIFQATTEGYVEISSTFEAQGKEEQNFRTLIPLNSAVVHAIDKGLSYNGIYKFHNEDYICSFEPLYIEDKIVGISFAGEKVFIEDEIASLLSSQQLFGSGFPFIINSKGEYLYHPKKTELNDTVNTFFDRINAAIENDVNYVEYNVIDNGDIVNSKIAYFKYYHPFDSYICFTTYTESFTVNTVNLRNILIISSILIITISSILIIIILTPLSKSLHKLTKVIREMAKGKLIENLNVKRNDEIGDIVNSLNILIQGWNNTANFAHEIEKGNFDSTFHSLSNEDILGNSLLDMRNSLQKSKEEDAKRKIEDAQRKWINEGLNQFANLLRQSSNNIEDLSALMIKEMVRYLNANQGGIFVYNDEEKNNEFLELRAAFAFNRQKFLEKKIRPGEGLVGACLLERTTNYIDDVPDNYVDIKSGLGGANPRCILIVPLIYENEFLGVIEIASFKTLEKYEIEFAQQVSETMAATLLSTKINEKTKKLLEESKQKSDEMAAQEEEMRQNLEELQATQEEVARKELEQRKKINQLTKENEAKIREIQKREIESKAIIEALNTTTLLFEYDFNGYIIYINDFALKTFGLLRSELIGKHYIDFHGNEEQIKNEYESFWAELKLGKIKKRISAINTNENSYWFSEIYSPIFDNNGNPVKVLKIAHDITQEKLRENELKQKMEEVELAKESSRRTIDKILEKSQKKEAKMIARLQEAENELMSSKKLIEKLKSENI